MEFFSVGRVFQPVRAKTDGLENPSYGEPSDRLR